MKRRILLIAAALLLTSVGAVAQNKVDKQGRRQGHWIRNDRNGSKIYEGDFVDGLETGTFTYFYPDGTVRIRNTYSEPGRRCLHEAYDEQGRLLARGEYNQRNRDGLWNFYAEDGRLVKEASYKMGIKDGRHVIYERNGDTAEVTHWADNHRHGRWWKSLGKKAYITANYVRGGIEGRLAEYDNEGRLAREAQYTEGLKNGESRLYEQGILTVRENWTHGLLVDRQIRLLTPDEHFVSVRDIACMAAQGKAKTVVFLKDGTRLVCHEAADLVLNRAGDEFFSFANRKNRISVSTDCVQGTGTDSEGRTILLLEPQPDFAIFPDEDGLKMVSALRNINRTPLDDIKR